MPNNNLSKSKQKEIKDLIEKGRQQGFLTIGEINDLLPTNLYDADQINSEMLLAMGYSEKRAGQIINIKCKG